MKKLPIGVQDFRKIREEDYLYVDKTKILYEIVEKGDVYFISRPRRFGKSLMISTLDCMFRCEKELFKGLWIEDKWNWEDKYPVIRVDFSSFKPNTGEELKDSLSKRMEEIGRKNELKLSEGRYEEKFKDLISKLKEKYKKNVVVLVDEYDKPILDHITKRELAAEMREVLKGFYTIIKAMDGDIKFVMLTGVTKFSKVGVFSGLNNLNDITMASYTATLMGYTQEELESNFEEHIKELAKERKKSVEEILELIKDWYNGYRFTEKEVKVYNPFSTLILFNQKKFDNYWFASGTPTFLINLLKEGDYFIPSLENLCAGGIMLNSFEVENVALEPLLYQTGYLTIRDVELKVRGTLLYKLTMPNKEVQISFNDILITELTGKKNGEVIDRQEELYISRWQRGI